MGGTVGPNHSHFDSQTVPLPLHLVPFLVSPLLCKLMSLPLSVTPACGLYPALPGPREEEEEEETEEEEEEDAHQFCCPASECSSPSSR